MSDGSKVIIVGNGGSGRIGKAITTALAQLWDGDIIDESPYVRQAEKEGIAFNSCRSNKAGKPVQEWQRKGKQRMPKPR